MQCARARKEAETAEEGQQKKKQQRLQFGKLETDGSLKKEKKTSAETDGGHFQAEKNDVSTNRKKGKQKYSRKTIKTYQIFLELMHQSHIPRKMWITILVSKLYTLKRYTKIFLTSHLLNN